MNVNETITKVAELGVLVCIAGIFLYTAIRVINIFLDGLSRKIKNKRHDQLLDLRSKLSIQIQSLIDVFLSDRSGDRVQVIEFSNSVVSVAYLPFKYMTCTYEVYKLGVPSTKQRIDRLSTSLFTPFFQALHPQGWCKFDTGKPEQIQCGAMRDIMIANGDTHSLYALIKTPRGKSIGYVSLKRETDFNEEDIDAILTLADQLAVLLGAVDK